MVVHDVDVHEIGGLETLDLPLEVDEVGGEDARIDAHGHPASVASAPSGAPAPADPARTRVTRRRGATATG